MKGILVGASSNHAIAGDGGGGGAGEVHWAVGRARAVIVDGPDVFQDAFVEHTGRSKAGEQGGDSGVLGQLSQIVSGLGEGRGSAAGHAFVAFGCAV